jgi:outer membrane receptor protein involved in Fe transport
MLRATDRWIVEFGGHVIDGRDDADDSPLADVPPDQFHAGVEHIRGGWTADLRWTHRGGKPDAGPGETPIGSAELFRFRVTRRLGGAWSVALTGTNLLDESYFRSADDKASPAAGRSFGFHLVRSVD